MGVPTIGIVNDQFDKDRRESKPMTSWHASGLGSCLRGQYFKRLGKDADKEYDVRTLKTFALGNMVEDMVVGKLQESEEIEVIQDPETAKEIIAENRGSLDDLQVKERYGQIYIRDEEMGVSGMIDGFLKYGEDIRLLEVKSQHSGSFHHMKKRGGPSGHHKMQLWWYLYVTGVEKGGLLYVSKDDQCMLEYTIMRKDKQLREKVLDTIGLLNKAWEDKDPALLPLPVEKWKGKYCSYHSHCEKVIEKNPEE